MNIFLIRCILLTSLTTTSVVSCSSSTTRTVETTTSNPDGSVDRKTVESEVSDSDSKSCSGVASCTVDFLGDVIAFPFRVVAGLAEAIF